MRAFKIKICGINSLATAKEAEKQGADLLGFIFYKKSPRFLSAISAKLIISKLKPTTQTVGVFVDETPEKVIKIAQSLKLTFIQLSGHEPTRLIAFYQKNGLKVIKTTHIKNKNDLARIKNSPADIIHLDRADKDKYGGTGKVFDWSLRPQGINNLMLSGGINIDNVAEGAKLFKPLIVDVNSGVERKPGVKSKKMIKEFIQFCNNL